MPLNVSQHVNIQLHAYNCFFTVQKSV